MRLSSLSRRMIGFEECIVTSIICINYAPSDEVAGMRF